VKAVPARTVVSDEDRERIIKEFLPFIKYTALRLSWRLPPHLTTDDLISVGVMGLLDALNRYREEEARLNTFVEHRIRGAMLDELRSHDSIPRSMKNKINSIKKAYLEVEKKLGRPPEAEEVAETLEITLDEYYGILQNARNGVTLRLDDFGERIHDEDGMDVTECIPDPDARTPLDIYEENDKRRMLAQLISELPEKEKLILSLYYWDEMTMKEIGRVLKLTEGRVCQLHAQALMRLKAKIER